MTVRIFGATIISPKKTPDDFSCEGFPFAPTGSLPVRPNNVTFADENDNKIDVKTPALSLLKISPRGSAVNGPQGQRRSLTAEGQTSSGEAVISPLKPAFFSALITDTEGEVLKALFCKAILTCIVSW